MVSSSTPREDRESAAVWIPVPPNPCRQRAARRRTRGRSLNTVTSAMRASTGRAVSAAAVD